MTAGGMRGFRDFFARVVLPAKVRCCCASSSPLESMSPCLELQWRLICISYDGYETTSKMWIAATASLCRGEGCMKRMIHVLSM